MLASEAMMDQAAGLRYISNPQPVRVIAVTSGKGGVGKSNVSVNIAVAMANRGHDVMLLDADLGLANIDVLLDVRPRYTLEHVVSGECTLEEAVVEGPVGVKIIPAASGVQKMAQLSQAEHLGLVRSFSELSEPIDTLIVDTAAGISDSVTAFTRAAREVVVVVCDEPASITDAYATIKVLSRDYKVNRFHVVANMARSLKQGRELFHKLTAATDKFLDVTLEFSGVIPYDEVLIKAVRQQKAVVDAYPRSPAGLAFKKLVQKIERWPIPTNAEGHLEFFVERLIRFSTLSGGRQ
ncbi:MAG: MinD/ParA family protein [Pseudomonadota bacterium]